MRMIILDNGHGCDTPGKRSPVWEDGSYLQEWKYCRAIVQKIARGLKEAGIPNHILVPEDYDIPLRTRVQRANKIAAQYGISQTLLISVHLNAAQLTNTASGWEVHTSPGETKSDEYARVFWETAKDLLGDKFPMRGDWEDGNPDRDSSFAIIRDTA
ncbi:MAG: N-acetylmuramoyl-L-alanine amidase, partial [Bacteroidales bacterium]|nr:N-acetylmuramoyl-L-alanine amidase [Bacteroidales bacterium]